MSAAAKPLAGKRIVLTGAADSSHHLAPLLTNLGAAVLFMPCIEFLPAEDQSSLDAAIQRIRDFDWIAFTSQNAVQFIVARARQLKLEQLIGPHSPKIAALGEATAAAVRQEGLSADFVDSDARSGGDFVSAFSPQAREKKILLPQSDQAGHRIENLLCEAGADVTCVVAYRTSVPESLNREGLSRIEREGADVIFFASPSGFRNFAQVAGRDLLKQLAARMAFAAIGSTTAQAIRDAGFVVGIEASHPKPRDIANAISDYFASRDRVKVAK